MKKKMTFLLAGVLAVSQLTSCGNKTEEVKKEGSVELADVAMLNVEIGENYNWYGSDNGSATGVYYDVPIVKLGEEDAKKYPELVKSITDLNKEKKSSLEEDIKSFKERTRVERFNTVGIYEEANLRRADENVLSLLFERYEDDNKDYKYSYSGVVFDVKTGKKLGISDIVKDTGKLPELIQAQFNEFYGSEFDGDIDNAPWVLDYNGITFMLDESVVVTVPYEGNEDIFNDKYFGVGGGYTAELINSQPFYYDTDGDGKLNMIMVSGDKEDEDYAYDEVLLKVDNDVYTEEMYSFDIDPLFVHTKDGKNYIYHMNELENDDAAIWVYNINKNVIEYVDVVPLGYMSNYYDNDNDDFYDDDDYFTETKITDPEAFWLETGTDVLSTLTGSEPYTVGKNGMPESTDDGFFEFSEGHELTLKRDLEVEIVDDASGNITGKATVKSGETVIYFRTDGKTKADLKLSDGRIGRVTLMNDEWPETIDGVEVEDIFDGVFWAG